MVFNPELIAFASRDALAERVADIVELSVANGIARDGRGELAVSGGSTPKPVYAALAKRDLAWDRTALTLVDERWVPPTHEASNETFVRNAFDGAPVSRIIGMYSEGVSPADGVSRVAGRLEEKNKEFDAVILGMGNDGHTASWFPHAQGLEEALSSDNLVCDLHARQSSVTGEHVDRITLTLSAIKSAAQMILLITGDDKRATFEKALEPGTENDMPVRAILRARPDMWVCWAP